MIFDRLLLYIVIFILLSATCWVLAPFLSILFWSAILAFASWPAMNFLTRILRGRTNLAAGILTCLWIVIVAVPLTFFAINLTDYLRKTINFIYLLQGQDLPTLPSWIARIPWLGQHVNEFWQALNHNGNTFLADALPYISKGSNFILAQSAQVGIGLFELILSLLLVFFFYRDGPALADLIRNVMDRLIGQEEAKHYIDIAAGTVQRVVNGVIGTAAAQGLLAFIGLAIAGIPGAILLGFITFGLSLIPMGPPLVWIPATFWLLTQEQYGFAIFLGLWGFFIISGVDNLLKPYLISRGGNLPLVVVLLGVFGGLWAFGFMGMFIGPTLLALSYSLLGNWIKAKNLINHQHHKSNKNSKSA